MAHQFVLWNPAMTRADNTRFLTQAAAERHQETLRKASEAIARLDSAGQPVNFSWGWGRRG